MGWTTRENRRDFKIIYKIKSTVVCGDSSLWHARAPMANTGGLMDHVPFALCLLPTSDHTMYLRSHGQRIFFQPLGPLDPISRTFRAPGEGVRKL